jgi:hypothetical protein
LSESPVTPGRAHPIGGDAAIPGEPRVALQADAALRGGAPALPPTQRSRVALGLTAAAAVGRFELQVCRDCGTVQYPPREACHKCLSVRLDWTLQPGDGELLAETTLFHSHSEFFRERLPWRLGMVRLDCGPTVDYPFARPSARRAGAGESRHAARPAGQAAVCISCRRAVDTA